MDYKFLSKTELFAGTSESETESMLKCLSTYLKSFSKGDIVFSAGSKTEYLGIVMKGCVIIENDDVWGNRSILGKADAGEIFAETYACIPAEPMLINVVAASDTDILFVNASKIIQSCSNSCLHHKVISENLIKISSHKNLALSRRILHTSSKSIRGRLLSYFSEQSIIHKSNTFTVTFNRQQLADYLNVDRSSMCNELSKMQTEGIINYDKNVFNLTGSKISFIQ